jgi:hypothetical protein
VHEHVHSGHDKTTCRRTDMYTSDVKGQSAISFVMKRVLFRVFRNSYSSLTSSFKSLCSRMRFVVEVIIICGGLPDFRGDSCSGRVFSALVVSVFMSVVLRGAKTLRVNTAFGGSLISADIGTMSADFLSLYEVSALPRICCLGPQIPRGFVHYTTLSCPCTHLQDVLQLICACRKKR